MIHVGFIGTGSISAAHLNYLKKRDDVAIEALCDINLEQVKKRQNEYGGKVFTDFTQMLDETQLDAVWLCTPPTVRKEPLIACAEKNIPVFCEKPVEHSLETATEIATGLARRKANVQIGYVFRSMPGTQQLRKAVANDTIHLIQSFYCCNVSLAMSLPAWFYDKEKSGGPIVDQATHNLDLIRYLFGEIKEIYGMAHNAVREKGGDYTIDEVIGLMFVFKNGMIGSHLHTWVGESWRNEFIISGERQLYRFNLNNGTLVVERTPQNLDIDSGSVLTEKKDRNLYFKQEPGNIYKYEDEQFLKQVITGDWSQNPSDYANGLKTLELTLACDKAVSNGKAQL